jgi:rRNA maturation RNase YbeY
LNSTKTQVAGIRFYNENYKYNVKSIRKIRQWLVSCAAMEGKRIQELNFIFCDDNYLLNINIKYLKHDYLTDIITFDYSGDKSILSGDAYISIDRAKENAILYKQTLQKEVKRLLIHGLLHLIGYSDKNEKAKKLMRELEDRYLEKFCNESSHR